MRLFRAIAQYALASVLSAVFVFGSFGIALAGCHKNVNSANPKVVFANTLLSASDAVDAVATGLVAANDTIEKLQTAEPDYYARAKPLLVKIAKANDQAIAAIKAAKTGDTSIDWRSAIVAVAGAVNSSDLTAFGFKNKDSQAAVNIGLASLQAALIAIPQSFGGK